MAVVFTNIRKMKFHFSFTFVVFATVVIGGIDKMDCSVDNPRKSRPFRSVVLLADVKIDDDGDIVGESILNQRSCPKGLKYDPFFKMCREPTCALPGFTLVNGECVKQ